jgi:transketolase
MRDAFFRSLTSFAEDERVYAVTADLGIGLFDKFAEQAPGRYLNVGIAEQNLISVAAGLAYAGKIPFAYSIAPFLLSRANDQVRVDVAAAGANVKLVGVGGGLAYGHLGPTHHAIEDLALMRALPGMTILAPADPAETERAARAALEIDGPVYLRLGKNGEAAVLPDGARFAVGEALVVAEGSDVLLCSTGAILGEAVAARDQLATQGLSATIVHFATVKPFDAATLLELASGHDLVITLEEHSIIGGLGSAAAEALAEAGLGVPLKRLGMPDLFAHEVGSQAHLRSHYALDSAAVAAAAIASFERAGR